MNLEKLLAENMLRFGSKNLTEWDTRKLKQILSEQKVDRDIDPSEWNISGFTAPAVRLLSSKETPKGKAFFDAYRAYMDFGTGMVGKTLLVFKSDVQDIKGVVLDPADVVQRIVIQSSYVPGPKAKDVTAGNYQQGAQSYIKIWETKQATRNFELATKTAVMQKGSTPNNPQLQPASFSLILAPGFGGVINPTDGMVRASGEYSLGMDFKVYKGGTLLGYAPINFDTDSVHKTEGWGSVLVSGGTPEANAWE